MRTRPELEELRALGFSFSDPFEIVSLFESRIAERMGAPYGVAVDCCTHALELSLRYLNAQGRIRVPKRTYLSVPMVVEKIGCRVEWTDAAWAQFYRLDPYPVLDASLCFEPGIYQAGTFMCLSFQQKKSLPIGRGGMILTSDPIAAEWLRASSYDGRARGRRWKEDPVQRPGYHYYMTPEDAARGLLLLHDGEFPRAEAAGSLDYPDLSKLEVFKSRGD